MAASLLTLMACTAYGRSIAQISTQEISSPSRATKPGNDLRVVGKTISKIAIKSLIEDYGGQVFNVRAYGATGNGTTDDTAAIQAANDAAEAVHGLLFFPAGTYLITSTLRIRFPVRWEGEFSASNSKTDSTIIKANAALDPMILIGHSNVEIDHIRIDANAEAVEGIRTQTSGAEPRAYNVVLRSVTIQDFPLSNSSVIGLDLGDYGDSSNRYACADCSFYNVEVLSGPDYQVGEKAAGVGIYISRENNQFYNLHLGGFNFGVLLGGGAYGEANGNGFFGGFIADDRTADISTTSSAKNIQNTWYNLWFEGSAGPIVGGIPPGRYVDQKFLFYNCELNTYSNRSILDLTNLVGAVRTIGGAYDISNSNRVITSTLGVYQSLGTAYQDQLTFIGNNYRLMGFPIRGSVTLGTRAVAAGACADQATQSIPGMAANQTISLSQNVLSDLLLVRAYTDSKPEIVVQLCNPATHPITPKLTTINYTIF